MAKKSIGEGKDVQIAVFEQEVSPEVKVAQALTIKDSEGMKAATERLSRLNQLNDRITEEKEKVTKPLNEALKAERNRWRPIEKSLEEAIDIIRNKMSVYQTAEIKRQREEQAKIAARVGEGRGKMKIETAVKKIDEIKAPEAQVATDSGMVKFREDKVLRITNESLIPRQFLVIDEKKVLEALKAGIVVRGAEIEIKMIPLNYR